MLFIEVCVFGPPMFVNHEADVIKKMHFRVFFSAKGLVHAIMKCHQN